MLWVTDRSGKKIDGAIEVSEEETRWQFRRKGPWTAGGYYLVIDKALEDLAGNSVGRPFEVDIFKPIQERPKTETVRLPFRIGSEDIPKLRR